jgi:hypothetical protein
MGAGPVIGAVPDPISVAKREEGGRSAMWPRRLPSRTGPV